MCIQLRDPPLTIQQGESSGLGHVKKYCPIPEVSVGQMNYLFFDIVIFLSEYIILKGQSSALFRSFLLLTNFLQNKN